MIHTGAWDEGYTKDQWRNERVAVIGSGASSVQTVPNMQASFEFCYMLSTC